MILGDYKNAILPNNAIFRLSYFPILWTFLRIIIMSAKSNKSLDMPNSRVDKYVPYLTLKKYLI